MRKDLQNEEISRQKRTQTAYPTECQGQRTQGYESRTESQSIKALQEEEGESKTRSQAEKSSISCGKGKTIQIQKWNFKTREYEPYEIPNEWNVKTYSNDMDEIVNCPHCGKEFAFGDCYTSRQIHTKFGGAFAVCAECYRKEWEDEKTARRQNNG